MLRMRTTALVMLSAIALTACGTRLPDESFGPVVNGQGRAPGAVEDGATGGGSTGSEADFSDLTGGGSSGPTDSADGGAAVPGGGPETSADGSGSAAAGAGSQGSASNDSTTAGSGDGGSANDGTVSSNDGRSQNTAANEASDTGVFVDRIKIGNMVDKGGPLGPHQFTPPYFGANAYFTYINATQGGIHGRQVEFITCDTKESADASFQCAERLIEEEKVFALVGNNLRNYASAEYVSDQGVPDIGGVPVGNEYWTYPTLFTILGSNFERNGTVGEEGFLYSHTGLFNWFALNTGITKAAVFYYSIPISKQQGLRTVEALNEHGVETIEFEVNPAVPQFDSNVATMQAEGVDGIFDTMDTNANRNLCDSMQRRNFTVKVKYTTLAGWTRRVSDQFPDVCRSAMYTSGDTLAMSQTDHPEVKLFNEVMRRVYNGQFDDTMYQWHFDGWLAAKMFHEAMETDGLGPTPTRKKLIEYFNTWEPGTYGGTMDPTSWKHRNWETPCQDPDSNDGRTDCRPARDCNVIARWEDALGDFRMVAGVDNCTPGIWQRYEASA